MIGARALTIQGIGLLEIGVSVMRDVAMLNAAQENVGMMYMVMIVLLAAVDVMVVVDAIAGIKII